MKALNKIVTKTVVQEINDMVIHDEYGNTIDNLIGDVENSDEEREEE